MFSFLTEEEEEEEEEMTVKNTELIMSVAANTGSVSQ